MWKCNARGARVPSFRRTASVIAAHADRRSRALRPSFPRKRESIFSPFLPTSPSSTCVARALDSGLRRSDGLAVRLDPCDGPRAGDKPPRYRGVRLPLDRRSRALRPSFPRKRESIFSPFLPTSPSSTCVARALDSGLRRSDGLAVRLDPCDGPRAGDKPPRYRGVRLPLDRRSRALRPSFPRKRESIFSPFLPTSPSSTCVARTLDSGLRRSDGLAVRLDPCDGPTAGDKPPRYGRYVIALAMPSVQTLGLVSLTW